MKRGHTRRCSAALCVMILRGNYRNVVAWLMVDISDRSNDDCVAFAEVGTVAGANIYSLRGKKGE
ncbi:hypothetical protein D3C86_1786750 [compost metagenome]